jgi:hypothetical protein
MADVVDILLRLRGSRAFQSEADKSSKAIGGIGKEAGEAGDKAGKGWKEVAKWAAPAAFFAGTAAFFKSAVTSTTDLAKSTMALQRSTGLSAETASAWGSVLKARGVDTKGFQMGMTKLSREMVKGAKDGKAYTETFKQLGVAQDTLRAGDVNAVLMQSADAFAEMTNPAERAALAQQLFGRQAQNLLPMMTAGSEGIREQLGWAEQYGATLSGESVDGVKDLIAKQREMKIAQEGLKITFGTMLLPAILDVVNALASLVRIVQPILRDSTVMTTLLGALAVAFIAYKVAVIASTIATLSFNAAFLLIPLAVIAVIAGLVILYKKVAWFRNAVNGVFEWLKTAVANVIGWLKGHWKLVASILGGPFVALAILIISNWRKIIDFIKSVPGKLAAAGRGMWNWVKDGFRSAVNWVLSAWNRLEFRIPGFDPPGPGPKFGGFTLGVPDIPLLAGGGTIARTGTVVVGERGPEFVTLPTGAQVIPNRNVEGGIGMPPPLDASAGQTIVSKVYLDRRQIAEAVGTYVSDRRARR